MRSFLLLSADVLRFVAEAGFALRPLALSQAEVDQHAGLRRRVVEKVGRFYVAVQDLVGVTALERGEERPQIDADVRYRHVAEVGPEVGVSEVGQDGDDLVRVPEGRDQGADRGAVPQVLEQVELVEDAAWGGRDVDLLDGDVARPSSLRLLGIRVPADGWWRPFRVAYLVFPVVIVVFVELVLGLVDGRKRACPG